MYKRTKMINVGLGVVGIRKVSDEYKQLTAEELNLQERLQSEVCKHLCLERYPSGYSGMGEEFRTYRCKHTGEDCVSKQGILGTFAMTFRRDEAHYWGLDSRLAERCPSRELKRDKVK